MSEYAAIERIVAATDAQRDIWMVDQLGPEASLSYCMSLKVDVRGELDRTAAAQAIQALYERHEALRATFSDDGVEMRIHRAGPVTLDHFDFASFDSAAREAALRERLQLAVERGFDLRSGPAFRAEVIGLEPTHHVILFRAHHIVCDGWSLGVLMSDFGRLYAQVLGHSGLLPAAPAFSDFAMAQAKGTRPADAENERFWAQAFEPVPAPLELPLVRQRPPVRSFASARMDYVLDPSTMKRVAQRAQAHGQSLFSVLFAAFNLVISRISGTQDVVIGVPTAEQVRAGLPGLVGYCVSFVPVRSQLDPAAPFLALVETTRAGFRAAMTHRGLTFARLLALLKLRRDPSRPPLVNVVLTSLRLAPEEVPGPPRLEMTGEHIARPFENFEILADVFTADGEARVECQYNTSLYDEQSVRGWFAAFETVLGAVADDFSIPCQDLPLIPAADRASVQRWNDTAADFDAEAVIHTRIEVAVRAFPDRTAVSFGAATLTYAALDAEANRLARAIRERGAGRGAMVGLLVERGPAMVVSLLAVLKAGAAYVPLDPAYPAERLAYMLAQSGVALLIVEAQTRSLMAALGRDGVRAIDLDADAAGIDAHSAAPLEGGPLSARPEDPAYVVYTSGSTGKPKGVIPPHRAVVNFLASMAREPGLAMSDRVLAVTTLNFDPAVLELLGPLTVGAEVILASRDQTLDAYALRELVESSKATMMQATPSTWRMLIEAGWRGDPGFKVLTGSEALRQDLARELLERAGEVWNLYGPTETTVWATCWRVTQPERGIFIGRPIANTTVWVLDERRQLCPLGVPGEIHIGGKGVASGYLERSQLTGERFIADRFHEGGRLYRTGDRGRWRHDGLLEYLGRLDFQIKVRGYRIEPGEIEANLATHPQVGTAVVVAREERAADARLVAYVVCKEPAPTALELREHLRRELPEYIIPQHIVHLEAMPRLPNGKIDRNGLPPPADATAERLREYVAPRSAAEIAIAKVWIEVLGVQRVGVTDNFFDLGGHSLLAMSAITAIQKAHGVRVSTRQMIYESLGQIASTIEGARETERATVKPAGWLGRLFGTRR